MRQSTPRNEKALKEVLLGAAEVLADSRFMLMIVVYSGFWVLYFQNLGSVLWYLRDFVDRAPVSSAVTSLLPGVGLPWTFTQAGPGHAGRRLEGARLLAALRGPRCGRRGGPRSLRPPLRGRYRGDEPPRPHHMRGLYFAVLLIGGVFLYVAFSSTPVQPRVAVQAAIFIALGAGGLLMGRSRD